MQMTIRIYTTILSIPSPKRRFEKLQIRKIDETHWKYRAHIITESDYSIKVKFGSRRGYEWTEPRSLFTVEGEYAHYGLNDGLTTLTMAKKAVDRAIEDGLRAK